VTCDSCSVTRDFRCSSLNQRALSDGCEYVYQSNDDVEFITKGWAEKFVNR
jgi:hypothetical protein